MSVTHLELYEQMDNQPTAFSRYNGGDEDDDDEEDGIPKIRIGICAMSKKVGVSQEALFCLVWTVSSGPWWFSSVVSANEQR